MNQELEFAKTLEAVKTLAKQQGNCVSEAQIEEAFGAIGLAGEQLLPIYEYLKNKNIGIGEPLDIDETLSEEEKDYLAEYIASLKELPELTEGEKEALCMSAMAGEGTGKLKLLELYLPQVIDIAKLYTGQGVFLEDLIGEGNVALAAGVEMLGCLETPEEVPGMLGKMMMDAMEAYIAENAQARQFSLKVVEQVNEIADKAKELAESLQRKITAEELAEEQELSLEEVLEAIRLSGGKIEYFQ